MGCVLGQMLLHPEIHGVALLRHVPVDIVQASIAYLNIYLAVEYKLLELDEGSDTTLASVAC